MLHRVAPFCTTASADRGLSRCVSSPRRSTMTRPAWPTSGCKKKRRGWDVVIENYVVSERPELAICERAEKNAAGLIVVGSHSRRGAERVVLGSAAESVVRRAPCSILVVR